MASHITEESYTSSTSYENAFLDIKIVKLQKGFQGEVKQVPKSALLKKVPKMKPTEKKKKLKHTVSKMKKESERKRFKAKIWGNVLNVFTTKKPSK